MVLFAFFNGKFINFGLEPVRSKSVKTCWLDFFVTQQDFAFTDTIELRLSFLNEPRTSNSNISLSRGLICTLSFPRVRIFYCSLPPINIINVKNYTTNTVAYACKMLIDRLMDRKDEEHGWRSG